MTLPDATRVFPAHGAGSMCGENLSTACGRRSVTRRRRTTPCVPRTSRRSSSSSPRGSRPRRYFVYDAILNRTATGCWTRPSANSDDLPAAARSDRRRRRAGRRPRAERSSPRATCATPSTSGWAAGTPSSPVRCYPSDVDIVLFTEPGQELRARTGSPESVSTG